MFHAWPGIASTNKNIKDVQEYAAATTTPCYPNKILAISYQLVFATGIFPDDCCLWKQSQAMNETWANFKTDFTQAHQKYQTSQVITPCAVNFHARYLPVVD